MASPKHRVFRGKVLYRILTAASVVAGRLPLSLNRLFGSVLGRIGYHATANLRNKAVRNIADIFPDWDPKKRRDVIRMMFRHLGVSVFETLWLRHSTKAGRDAATKFEGFDRVLEHIHAGRAVMVFTAHYGNWEWLSYLVGVSAPNVSVTHRDRNEPALNEFIVETRARANVESIGRGSDASPREIMRCLRRGGILAFLIDQSIRVDSVKVPFFGRPTLTPFGPAKLAIRGEAVAVAAFIERRNGVHHIVFQETRQMQRGDDPVKLTAEMTAAIEAQIRRSPEQWVWFHDRWKDRPKWNVGKDEG